ncbi:MAG: sigma factor-like helix-turn-helix DNA-binding protein, partial [Phycisphaeraceae bacterium]
MMPRVVTPSAEPDNPPPSLDAKAFGRSLLRWYRKHRRDLPWRPRRGEPTDPYHTLVSEAMLQQTQVATVVPYFHRFIDAFPSVKTLADADEQQARAAVAVYIDGMSHAEAAKVLGVSRRTVDARETSPDVAGDGGQGDVVDVLAVEVEDPQDGLHVL